MNICVRLPEKGSQTVSYHYLRSYPNKCTVYYRNFAKLQATVQRRFLPISALEFKTLTFLTFLKCSPQSGNHVNIYCYFYRTFKTVLWKSGEHFGWTVFRTLFVCSFVCRCVIGKSPNKFLHFNGKTWLRVQFGKTVRRNVQNGSDYKQKHPLVI